MWKKCGEQIRCIWMYQYYKQKFEKKRFLLNCTSIYSCSTSAVWHHTQSGSHSGVLFLLIMKANRPESLRHIRSNLLFSKVMLCRADVSLGKCLDSKAYIRLCLAACSGSICKEWELQTRWPKSESVGKYMFVFCKEPFVGVSDPPKSQQLNGLINQLSLTLNQSFKW